MKPVFVLDIGTSKVVCLAASLSEKGPMKVQAIGIATSKGVKRGAIVDLAEVSGAIQLAIKRVESDLGQKVTDLLVNVGGTEVEGTVGQGLVPIFPRSRSITREDVLQVINHSRQIMLPPDREMVQSIPREFRIDGQRGIQKPIGMNGSRLEVSTFIVTSPMSLVQNLESAIGTTGGRIDQFCLGGLASALGVATEEEIESGVVVLDIGAGKTDLVVLSGGSINYAATLPIGAGHVTSDLSKLLKASPDEAERLKIRHGIAQAKGVREDESVDVVQLGQTTPRPLQRRVLCEIIESRMREIATMTWQHVERSGMVGMLPGGLVLTGGGSRLPATDELFADTVRHLRVRQSEPSEKAARDAVGLACALGLARYGLQCQEDELIPASGGTGWKEKVRTFWSLMSGR
jgi:cell division protein FtsA